MNDSTLCESVGRGGIAEAVRFPTFGRAPGEVPIGATVDRFGVTVSIAGDYSADDSTGGPS
jgi:hypothetical protein